MEININGRLFKDKNSDWTFKIYKNHIRLFYKNMIIGMIKECHREMGW